MMKIYIQCAFFCLPQDELLGETDSLLPPKLGAELLNFLTKVLASLSQIPKQLCSNEETQVPKLPLLVKPYHFCLTLHNLRNLGRLHAANHLIIYTGISAK